MIIRSPVAPLCERAFIRRLLALPPSQRCGVASIECGIIMPLIALTLLLTAPPAAFAQINWPKATLHLSNQRQFEAEVLIRDDREWVRIRKPDNPAEIRIPVSEIVGIEFHLPIRENGADLPYYEGRFAEAAQKLAPIVEPVIRFVDIRNNANDDVVRLVGANYWSGSYTQAVTLCENILRRTSALPFAREIQMYRILSLLNLGDYARVEKLALELPRPAVRDDWAAEYWAVKSLLYARDQKWDILLDSTATLIAFSPQEAEWMPLGLGLSARAHLMKGRLEVARQILNELAIAYPDHRWQSLVAAVETDLKKAEAEKPKAAATEGPAPAGT